jgi:DNA-binding MarR family transcriptional regulator
MQQGLGTQLRHLTELLDEAVGEAYAGEGLAYRPRYTPIFRALLARREATVGRIAEIAGITQPAATQTIALMAKDGLVVSSPGSSDRRQRLIRLSDEGRALAPHLQACWRATAAAAADLDADLSMPLSALLQEAIAALTAKPFGDRIAAARQAHQA